MMKHHKRLVVFCIVFYRTVTVHSFVMNLYGLLHGAFYSQKRTIHHRISIPISSKVWIEDAEEDFVDEDENLMMGEVCLKSIKAFAQDITNVNGDGDNHDDDKNLHHGDNHEKRFLGAAALVQRPTPFQHIHDCWIADALMDETNVQFKGAILLLDSLFLCHLQGTMKGTTTTNTTSTTNTITANTNQSWSLHRNIQDAVSSFLVQCGHPDSEYHCASYMAALSRGFKPLKDMVYFDHQQEQYVHQYTYLQHLDLEHENLDALVFDLSSVALDIYGYGLKDNVLHCNKEQQQQIRDIILQGMMEDDQGQSFQ